jgi:uncharacterized protein
LLQNNFISKLIIVVKGIASALILLIVSQYFTLLIFIPIPLSKTKRKLFYKKNILWVARFILKSHFNIKTTFLNPFQEDFKKPAIIIANHQTIFDAITVFALSYNFAVITTDWMYHTFFRFLFWKYIDNITTTDGNENMIKKSEDMIKMGNLPLIFPEGARRYDRMITRFHKGAFLMAAQLGVDILPVVICGSDNIHSKKWFFFKTGTIQVYIGKRIPHCDSQINDDIRLQAKKTTAEFREIYAKLQAEEIPK